MQVNINLPKEYLEFPEPFKRMSRIKRLAHVLLSLFLSPICWVLSYLTHTPGLKFRYLCALKGLQLLIKKSNFITAYGLIVAPLDSVRYFEFDFMWHAVKKIKVQSYLDVSSPRMLPLMIVDQVGNLEADIINPDKKDLPDTILLAKSLGIAKRCRFHDRLLEDVSLKLNSYDLITSMSVVEHIEDDKKAIQKMWDLLKPGGVLMISVPCAAKASEEYTNLNDYELIEADENGFVFWQRYYDEELIKKRIYSVTGIPVKFRIYGEKKAGSYHANVMQKRSNPFYPYWQEPLVTGLQYNYKSQLSELVGMGVIAFEFVKKIK